MQSIEISSLLNLDRTIAKDVFRGLTYPFEALPKISGFIKELIKTLDSNDFDIYGEYIAAHKTAVIAPSANITGPCIIDAGAEVRHSAFIRGNAIVGKKAVVGNSTELKNVILFDKVQVPHYNYVGDSILGYRAHMGAGAITSNVKSDKSLVTIKINDIIIETGIKKFGAIIGDNVEIGCNSVLNPGTVIGVNSNVYPLSSVRGYVPKNKIYKSKDDIVTKRGAPIDG